MNANKDCLLKTLDTGKKAAPGLVSGIKVALLTSVLWYWWYIITPYWT